MLISPLWILVVVSESASLGTQVAEVTVSTTEETNSDFSLLMRYVIWSLDICACVSRFSQATDRDSGKNGEINFKVTLVRFVDLNNVTSDKKLLFTAVTTQRQDIYVGLIQWVRSHRAAAPHSDLNTCYSQVWSLRFELACWERAHVAKGSGGP